MQIKKRLRINALFTVIMAAVILLMLFVALLMVNRAVQASGIADRIVVEGFERVALRNDFIRTNSERAKTAWRAKHEQIGKLLQEASTQFRDPEDRKNIEAMLSGNESIGKFFADIVANREKTGFRRDQAGLSEVENRLINQLNMQVYETIMHGRSLQESSRKALLSALKFAGSGIISVLAIVVAGALFSSWTMNRTIRDRVGRLRNGTAVIGGGDLDHRIDIKGDDEFAEISKAFDEMTAKLRGSYHDLEKQIEERKLAEEKLQKAYDELELREQRIAERTIELQDVNTKLLDSRRAALNMMEDAVAARNRAEAARIELQSEVADRKQAEEALRESEELLRFHLENTPMAVVEWDKNFIITRWTGGAERLFGWSSEETIGKKLSDMNIVYEEDKNLVQNTIARLTDGLSQQVVSTNRNCTKTGDVRHCTWYNSVLIDRDERMSSVLSLVQDITERIRAEEGLRHARDELELRVAERTKELAVTIETLLEEMAEREKAEGRLQRLNRLYAVLSETDQAIVRATDKESLFRDFCRIAVEQGGFVLSWVGLVDEESGRVNVVAASGATAYLDGIRITTDEEPTGEGPTGIAIREGTYFICNDFVNAPCTSPWHEKGLDHGICASASVALKEEGRVIGALTLYAGVKDFFDQQHADLLKQMGADVSFALDNFTREERRRKTEQALREETLERLRAVEALREKEQMLLQQSRMAAMGEMINNIAHQWRQPLNVLGLNIQRTMLFYELGDFSGDFLKTSTDDAMKLIKHMSQTIDDFRNFFKTDKEKTFFSVETAVKWTISLLKDGLNSDHIDIVTRNVGDPHINGYFNEFCQVLLISC